MRLAYEILNILLDKYERSSQSKGNTCNRRILLKLDKDFIKYRNSDYEDKEECNHTIIQFKEQHIIDFKWEKHRVDMIIEEVWLNKEYIQKAYSVANREYIGDIIQERIKIIKKYMSSITTPWILDFLHYHLDYISSEKKLKKLFNKDMPYIEDVLLALDNIDKIKEPIPVRVFSSKCYKNSKTFENKYQNCVLSIIKKYEYTIKDLLDKDPELEISNSEILSQIGIISKPEIFEFSGNCDIFTSEGSVNSYIFKSGMVINNYFVNSIENIKFNNITDVIFIENRTNYYDYILNQKENEFVIFHGGFYSPQKAKFFRKLIKAVDDNIKVYFWGDIDLGGFNMFVRLKENIILNLQPLNMGLEEYKKYLYSGLEKNEDYLGILKGLLNDEKYRPFYDVIENIILNRKTIEQENFLI